MSWQGKSHPPLLPSTRDRAGGPVGVGRWAGGGAAAHVKSLNDLGTRNGAGSGAVRCEIGGWMHGEMGRPAGQGPALGAEARSPSARGR